MLDHGVKPEIEAFDLSMIFKAVEMERAGKIKGPLHVQFVMGVKNAMPVDREVFEFYVATLKRAGAGRDLDRRRHRQGPAHAQPLVARARRPLPHRPRGQCPAGQEHAGQEQRRAGAAGGRPVRRVWPAGGDGAAGARAAEPARRGLSHLIRHGITASRL